MTAADNCQDPRGAEGHGAIAAEVGAPRHLHSNAADVAERFIQVTHADSLYTAKYRNWHSLSTGCLESGVRTHKWNSASGGRETGHFRAIFAGFYLPVEQHGSLHK